MVALLGSDLSKPGLSSVQLGSAFPKREPRSDRVAGVCALLAAGSEPANMWALFPGQVGPWP